MNCPHSATRALVLAATLALAGCALHPGTANRATPPAPAGACSERLFFGRSLPGGGEVSDAQWEHFVATEIAPRFPRGFTIWRGTGHWRGEQGDVVQETAMVLEVLTTGEEAATHALTEIARAYRQRFRQDAVLRTRTPAEMELVR